MATGSSQFLSSISGQEVIVKLHSGIEYHGLLDSIDGFMNIVLNNTREVVNNKQTREYGDVFVRGNNVLYIAQA